MNDFEPEFEVFDVNLTCDLCHGQGKIRKRMKQRPGANVRCRKCKGTGMFATGPRLVHLLKELEALKSRTSDTIHHITELKDVIKVQFNPVGVEISSSTGDFLYIQAGTNRMVIAVKPSGAKTVEEWEILRQSVEQKEASKDEANSQPDVE